MTKYNEAYCDVLIVGAGPAGVMAAAHLLSYGTTARPHRVRIFDATKEVNGSDESTESLSTDVIADALNSGASGPEKDAASTTEDLPMLVTTLQVSDVLHDTGDDTKIAYRETATEQQVLLLADTTANTSSTMNPRSMCEAGCRFHQIYQGHCFPEYELDSERLRSVDGRAQVLEDEHETGQLRLERLGRPEELLELDEENSMSVVTNLKAAPYKFLMKDVDENFPGELSTSGGKTTSISADESAIDAALHAVWDADDLGAAWHLDEASGLRAVDWNAAQWFKSGQPWTPDAAKSLQEGRVFLAGDARHRHPPLTGIGKNTSIADCYNLTWKLLGVLLGVARADPARTYVAERVYIRMRAATDIAVDAEMESLAAKWITVQLTLSRSWISSAKEAERWDAVLRDSAMSASKPMWTTSDMRASFDAGLMGHGHAHDHVTPTIKEFASSSISRSISELASTSWWESRGWGNGGPFESLMEDARWTGAVESNCRYAAYDRDAPVLHEHVAWVTRFTSRARTAVLEAAVGQAHVVDCWDVGLVEPALDDLDSAGAGLHVAHHADQWPAQLDEAVWPRESLSDWRIVTDTSATGEGYQTSPREAPGDYADLNADNAKAHFNGQFAGHKAYGDAAAADGGGCHGRILVGPAVRGRHLHREIPLGEECQRAAQPLFKEV
uniref:Phenol 2-monooxygenase n=1 Tax=Ralstonia pickettii TaxID=329 RepID=TBUD_RALPI|nr:RecName: Full=Phenol 2-monooxygenase; AltName: Full=Phenol hydroxylase [Ralstonia pickettii]AAA25992.1 phenol hydroxylase [Ralstonia pickettii]